MVVQPCTTLQVSPGYRKEATYQLPELYLPSLYEVLQPCTRLYKVVPPCLRLYYLVQGCTTLYNLADVPRIHKERYVSIFRALPSFLVRGYINLYEVLPSCMTMYHLVQGCTTLYEVVQPCTTLQMSPGYIKKATYQVLELYLPSFYEFIQHCTRFYHLV